VAGGLLEAVRLGVPGDHRCPGGRQAIAVLVAHPVIARLEHLDELFFGLPHLCGAFVEHLLQVEGELQAVVGAANVELDAVEGDLAFPGGRPDSGPRRVVQGVNLAEGVDWKRTARADDHHRAPGVAEGELGVGAEDRCAPSLRRHRDRRGPVELEEG